MTSSEGHEEGAISATGGDDGAAARRTAKAEAKAAKAARKAARKAAKREAAAAQRAAKAAARAKARAESRAAKSVRDSVKAEAQAAKAARAKAARAARAAVRAEAKAAKATAKAEAKAAKRAARDRASTARAASALVSHASSVLEEAAVMLRQGVVPAAVASDAPDGQGLRSEPAADAAQAMAPEVQAEPAGAILDNVPAALAAPDPADPETIDESVATAGAAEIADPGAVRDPARGSDAPRVDAEATGAPAATVPEAVDRTAAHVPELTAGETPIALLAPETAGPSISPPSGALVAASIDIGSTSVHLLVGAVDGHRVTPLLDESVFLGLGDRVGGTGYFGDEVRAALIADLARYVAAARELGATSVTIVGTEPMRRAADAGAVVHELGVRTGVAVHVLDHVEEGLLTLIGATGGSPVSGELLLVDIGGGSTEFVVVGAGRAPLTVGLPLGAARLTRELVRSDPPSLREIELLRLGVDAVVGGAPEASPSEIVAVGGTASNLLRLLPATAVDRSLTRRRIAVALAMLTVERSGEAAVRHLIRPERARILPAGAIIVDVILERYRSDRLRVSEAGIREGVILASTRGGGVWRDQLPVLARGWHDRPSG